MTEADGRKILNDIDLSCRILDFLLILQFRKQLSSSISERCHVKNLCLVETNLMNLNGTRRLLFLTQKLRLLNDNLQICFSGRLWRAQ